MATGKRFYWMKLKENFMASDTIDYFMSKPNGANYVVLYQMLCLKTINTGGRLSREIGEMIIPFDVDKIVRDCKWFSADTVRVALELFKSFGLIYEDVDGILVIADHSDIVGSGTDWAEKKQKQRLGGGDNVPTLVPTNVPQNVPIDIRDKEIDIRDKYIPPLPPNGGQVESLDVKTASGPAKARNRSKTPAEGFDEFWTAYPAKKAKVKAREQWDKLRPDATLRGKILAAIESEKKSDQWQRDNGRFIPHPATWLRQERWEDEPLTPEGTHGKADTMGVLAEIIADEEGSDYFD